MTGRATNTTSKQWLVELIQNANNMVPPLKESEVVFTEPNDGAWNINGIDYTALVEMNFKPGGRSDSSIAIPFYYNLIDVVSLFAAMGKAPVFAVAGGSAVNYTVEEILEKVNTLCAENFLAFKITPGDVVMSAKQVAIEAAEYGGKPVHTLYSLDFTPSYIFKGTLQVYFADIPPLTLSNAYLGPLHTSGSDIATETISGSFGGWIKADTRVLTYDGVETIMSLTDIIETMNTIGREDTPMVIMHPRLLKSDQSRFLLLVGGADVSGIAYRRIPKQVYINGYRYSYSSRTNFGTLAGPVPYGCQVTYIADNGLHDIVIPGQHYYVYIGDETMEVDPLQSVS